MVERYEGDPLPPAHPDPHGRPPLADGDTVTRTAPEPTPADLRRDRRRALLFAALVVAIILIGVWRR